MELCFLTVEPFIRLFFYARFYIGHTANMNNIDHLISLRNAIRNSQEGKLLIEYLSDIITSQAINPNKNAEQLKGMAELLHEIKTLPEKVDRVLENRRSN